MLKCPVCNNEKFIVYTNEPFCIDNKGDKIEDSMMYVLDDILVCTKCKYMAYEEKFKVSNNNNNNNV